MTLRKLKKSQFKLHKYYNVYFLRFQVIITTLQIPRQFVIIIEIDRNILNPLFVAK